MFRRLRERVENGLSNSRARVSLMNRVTATGCRSFLTELISNFNVPFGRALRTRFAVSPSWWDLAYGLGAPWDLSRPPDELVELIELGHLCGSRALDIGCGTGTSVIYLAIKGFDAYGLDISKVAIGRALAKAQDQGVKCNLRLIDFIDGEAVSKLSTFKVLLDAGCFHSLSDRARLRYRESIGLVSQPASIYLLWCFVRGPRWSYGPPGINQDEVEKTFSKEFDVLEKRNLDTTFRRMLFYVMRRAV